VFDLYEEFKSIISALEQEGIEYAVCGGLAMAVHGLPRATVDIDLLIRADDLEAVKALAKKLGYVIDAMPMTFAKGAIEIRRVSKIDPETGIVLSLDLLLVTPQTAEIWASRSLVNWEEGVLSVLAPKGLIELKSFRGSGQDLDDIKRLRELV
jgi:putative nucleotidyltransferase-like protein